MSSVSNSNSTDKNPSDCATTAWVFAGGDYSIDLWSGFSVDDGDIIVGVDKGIEHCLMTGLVPDVLIGDFDSVSSSMLQDARLQNSTIQQHPARKNSSDLELALHCVAERSVQRVTLFGVSGGRSDHHLFNWLLPLQRRWPFELSYIDASVHAYLVCPEYPLQATVRLEQIISLLPMPEASGVSTEGLDYALQNAELTGGSTLGLSNVACSAALRVSVSAGQLLVFCVK